MWYAISIGSGLVLGISLMIWGIVERGKRAKAELALEGSRGVNTKLRASLVEATAGIQRLTNEGLARKKQLSVLRSTVDELRDKLRTCRDPETVRAWLDEELGRQV